MTLTSSNRTSVVMVCVVYDQAILCSTLENERVHYMLYSVAHKQMSEPTFPSQLGLEHPNQSHVDHNMIFFFLERGKNILIMFNSHPVTLTLNHSHYCE